MELTLSKQERERLAGGPGGAPFKVGSSIVVEEKYYDRFYKNWSVSLPSAGPVEWRIRAIGQCLWRQRRMGELVADPAAPEGKRIPRWLKIVWAVVIVVLLGTIAARSTEPIEPSGYDEVDVVDAMMAQLSRLSSITWQDSGSAITNGFFAYPFTINCGTNLTCTSASSVVTIASSSSSDVIQKGTNTLLSTENVILDGSTNPRDITLGIIRILQTPNMDSTRGIAIITDAAGFGDTKALEIDWTATGVAAGDFEAVIDIDIDTANSSGGNIIGLEITETTIGSATTYGMLTGVGINPILNEAGSFGNIETAFTFDSGFTDVTSDFNSTGSDVQMFVSNGDLVYIGMAALFDEVEFILAVTASNAGIKPTFEYSDGASGWTTFSPTDNTNGMRQNGDLVWIASALAGWAQDTVNSISGKFWIRITRGAVVVSTPPTEDLVQVNADVEYVWDSSGNLNIASVSSGFNAEIADAGFIRVGNAEDVVCAELATPGVDLCIQLDASDIWQADGTWNATTLTEGANAVPNATESPAAGDISGSYSAGLTVDAGAVASAELATANKTFVRPFVLVDSGGLSDTDDVGSFWRAPAALTVTEVWCEVDTGTTTSVNIQRDDGSPADVLSSDLTCSTTGATGTIDTGEDNFAADERFDFVMVAAGTALRMSLMIKYTTD